MTRAITPWQDMISLWKLYRLFRKEKPDIIHSHTPKAGLLAMIAGWMAGVKVRIHTIAGLRFTTATGTSRKIMVAMEKLTGRMATHVWPNSRSLYDYIVDNKLVKPAKLSIIGKGSSNGIDLHRFSRSSLSQQGLQQTRELINYDPSLFYIVAIGRIVKDKGIAELSSAFVRSYESNPRLRLVLVGGFEDHLDPLDSETLQLVKSHPGIILAGWHDDVEYFLALSNLFVHASYREGFPNVVLQAGAMECPALVSRIPGCVDIVDHEENGLIFEVQNAEDLYQKLQQAIREPEKMKERASKLRRKIEENFERKHIQELIREQYLLLNR
jgi:glycosyltransferase involved in cell wall biosynthesis